MNRRPFRLLDALPFLIAAVVGAFVALAVVYRGACRLWERGGL